MEYCVFSCISLESRSQSVPNLAKSEKLNLTLFRMGIFGAAHLWGTERPPSLKSVTHILQWWNLAVISYLKKIQKIYESCDTSLTSADISIFSLEISKCCYIKKYRYRLHFSTLFLILLAFLESLKICLINLAIILMTSANMDLPGLLKITVFRNKGFDVKISTDGTTNKILSGDSNYIVDVFIWPQFANCGISMREVITTSTSWGLDHKNRYFWGVFLFQVQ